MPEKFDSLPSTLRSFQGAEVRCSAQRLIASLGRGTRVVLDCERDGRLRVAELSGPEQAHALTLALRLVFEHRPAASELTLQLPADVARELAGRGLIDLEHRPAELTRGLAGRGLNELEHRSAASELRGAVSGELAGRGLNELEHRSAASELRGAVSGELAGRGLNELERRSAASELRGAVSGELAGRGLNELERRSAAAELPGAVSGELAGRGLRAGSPAVGRSAASADGSIGGATIEPCAMRCARGALAQHAPLWLRAERAAEFPLRYVVSEGKRHPLRPRKPQGLVYERQVAAFGSTLRFRTLDPERDLDRFHAWMNDPRIAPVWELAGPRAEHRTYLERVERDPHTLPLIGEWDSEPFGYFEVYWAKEDRVAPFYAADDYDRGLHVLVGEQRFRGSERVAVWLSSLAHYAFLDDPRTRNVVAEPRADNTRMIGYFTASGFHRQRTFDFPHKRAALMLLPREVFFDEHCP